MYIKYFSVQNPPSRYLENPASVSLSAMYEQGWIGLPCSGFFGLF
jgi:hypothetical protein